MATVIDLDELGSAGVVIQGASSVEFAGDFDGDGAEDIIIGVPGVRAGNYVTGAAYVIFGGLKESGTIDIADLTPADTLVIEGYPDSFAGRDVSTAGDVNGDGFEDILVCAYWDYGNYTEAHIIFGGVPGPGSIELAGLQPMQGFTLRSEALWDAAGASLSEAGDVNGDGIDDFILGAPGIDSGAYGAGGAYVVFGRTDGFDGLDLGSLDPSDPDHDPGAGFLIQGIAEYDTAGFSVSSCGDINADGYADLLIGAPEAGTGYDAGEAYIIFGKEEPFGTIDLAALAPEEGLTIRARRDDSDRLGYSVSSAGDVNGDGVGDIIVGAPWAGVGYDRSGEAYVIFGKSGGMGDIDLTTFDPSNPDYDPNAGFIIRGSTDSGNGGCSVSGAGDVNADGFADVIVGARDAGPGLNHAGDVCVIFGKAGGFDLVEVGRLSPADGFRIKGTKIRDHLGGFVSSAGDANGDGFSDVVMTSSGEDGPKAYVIFGAAPTTAVTRTGSAAGQTIRGGAFGDTLLGMGGDDSLFGGLGSDVLDGGEAADLMRGGLGNDVYVADHRGDRAIEGGEAGGTDLVRSSVSFTLGAGLENLKLAGTSAVRAIGNDLANLLGGNSGANLLDGRAGADTMEGGYGDDTYVVNESADEVYEAKATGGEDGVRATVSYTLPVNVENLALMGTGALGGTGNALANELVGNAAANVLRGGEGDDRLDGRAGADRMIGGGGNDVYVVDRSGDFVFENSAAGGIDRVTSSVSFGLGGRLENLTLVGSAVANGTGNGLANMLKGNVAANLLSGGAGADSLAGGGGNDRLHGGAGKDLLRGDAGTDRFYFDTALNALTNVDTISGFSEAEDKIFLDREVFEGLAADGTLRAAAFRIGTEAEDVSDRIIFDRASGKIFYDGDGAGGMAQILFATVAPGTDLTNVQFVAFI